jgi:hypothetical protein
MTGWTQAVDRWLFFLLVIFCIDLLLGNFFRTMTYTFPTQEVASAASIGAI